MKSSRVSTLATALWLGIAVPVGAQTITDPAAELANSLLGRAAQIRALQTRARAGETLSPADTPSSTVSLQRDIDRVYLALIPQVSQRALQTIEERRVDKQVGDAAGSTAGSTSLVSRGGTPAIFAVAVENGALAQDVSGTTVTFRGTPASIIKSLGDTGYFETLKTDDAAVAVLQKLSFAVSFDTARGAPEGGQPAFTAQRDQFSAASMRFTAIDNKDPRAAVNDPRWTTFGFTQMDLDSAALKAFDTLRQDQAVIAWVSATQQAIAAASVDQIEAVVFAQFRALGSVDIPAATRAAVVAAGQQFEGLLKRRADVLQSIAGGGQLVFDWAYQQPTSGPESSNLKLVGSVGRSLLLTGNGGLTLYHGGLTTAVDRVRDIQAAIQFDVPFGSPDGIGRYVISLAAKVQHMPKDLLAGEGMLFPGTKGTIWLGQLKLTIPVKGSAAKIPLAVTLANRTELIREKKVFARANVGFSYDLDAVFARFKP